LFSRRRNGYALRATHYALRTLVLSLSKAPRHLSRTNPRPGEPTNRVLARHQSVKSKNCINAANSYNRRPNQLKRKKIKMSKPRIRAPIRNAFFVACGVTLCTVILIPALSALFLVVFLQVPVDSLSGHWKLLVVLLGSSISVAAAFGVSGFLMALFISCFSRNREMILTLFAAVLVAIIFMYMGFLLHSMTDLPFIWGCQRVLEQVLNIISLVGFATLGAWLVKRKRQKAGRTTATLSHR